MFFKGIGIDKDVIYVCDGELIKTVTYDVVDVGLEGAGSIGETKRHDEVLEVNIMSAEGGFVLVSRGDTKPVECIPDIDLGEELRAFDTIEEFRNQR